MTEQDLGDLGGRLGGGQRASGIIDAELDSASLPKGVGERGVVHEARVGQGLQKSHQVVNLLIGGREAADKTGLEWTDPSISRQGAGADHATASRVVHDDLAQGHDAAIVHVGSGQRHVTQARRAEEAPVSGIQRQIIESLVVVRVAALAIDVVKSVVEERILDAAERRAPIPVGHRELRPAVAVEALEALPVEQREAAALLRSERGLIAGQVAIVGAAAAHQRAAEAGQGEDDLVDGRAARTVWKCLAEQRLIARIGVEAQEHLGLIPIGHAELDRAVAADRHRQQILQLEDAVVRPAHRGEVGDVGQPGAVAAQDVPRGACRLLLPIAEGEPLEMAAHARLGLISREPLVIKQTPPELDLDLGERVRSRDGRDLKMGRQREQLAQLGLRVYRCRPRARRAEQEPDDERGAG